MARTRVLGVRRPRESLTTAQARRVALAAQGFARPRPDRPVGMRDVQSVITRLGQFQIDSINVVQRAHYLPLYSRLGNYETALLDRAAHRAPRRLYEYWGHAASLIDVTLQPLLRFRAEAGHRDAWQSMERIAAEQPDLVAWVYEEVANRGPISARQIEHDEVRDRSHWGWNWSSVKTVLEWLFYVGKISSTRRNSQFERIYAVPERVFPKEVLATATPSPEESVRGLVRRAARALGVATEACLRDYFRTRSSMTRVAVAELVDSGELLPVRVQGWDRPAWLWHEATVPRRIDTRALLSPFDSMIFERDRLEALFDFFYRIEIYVPRPQRQYGYYVYPLLLGDQMVGRVDLKADRAAGVLRTRAAWLEPRCADRAGEVSEALAAELATMAEWLGLSDVEPAPLRVAS